MAALVVVLAAASSPWWGTALLARSGYFAVRQVEVVGARYLAPEDVTRQLELGADASVWLELGKLTDRVARMSGVARARVSRRLPGTLVVTIAEREPVALAEGPEGLVAVAADAAPLPFDLMRGAVDAPLIATADVQLVRGLAVIQATAPGLYGGVSAASLDGGLTLELAEGKRRVRLDLPVDPAAVRAVTLVQRDLAARGLAWREVDGRFRGWVVVRPAPEGGAE